MRAGLNIILRSSIDLDALAYCQRSGATARRDLSDFVRGLKSLGLWEKVVFWSGRASQNAGTGSVMYSAGGLGRYDATMANGPTWADDGVRFVAANSQYGSTSLTCGSNGSLISVFKATGTANAYETPVGFQDGGVALARNATGAFFGLGVPGSTPPSLNQLVAQNEIVMLAIAGLNPGAQVETSKNGAGFLTAASGAGAIGTNSLAFGRHVTTNQFFFGGTIAFNAYTTAVLSRAQVAALYQLYTATLGKGLGLP